jgi:hypothetical protein
MIRFFPLFLVGSLATGCGLREDAFQLSPPEKVKLPFRHNNDKGGLLLTIEAIPNRSDAVRVRAHCDGVPSEQSKEWTQEGKGSVKLQFRGNTAYHVDIGAMRSQNGIVTEVEIGIRAKYQFD